MRTNGLELGKSGFTSLLALTSLSTGCTTSMTSDESGRLMNSGLSQTRNGVSRTQAGVNEFAAGSPQNAMTDMSSGIEMMNSGMGDMQNAMGMMSGTMMINCMDGGSAIMLPMQQAMGEINQGNEKLSDVDATNDAVGMAQMNSGLTMMNSAIDQAQNSMSCMGHGQMMM